MMMVSIRGRQIQWPLCIRHIQNTMNRQESHRIYLQSFAPRCAHPKAGSSSAAGAAATVHRHDSHDIHPPNYPTNTTAGSNTTNPVLFHYNYNSSSDSSHSSYSFSSSSFSSRHGSQGQGNPTTNSHLVASPTTVTTTAAVVRLTDKAKTKDVTPLLRSKFGLPRIIIPNDENQAMTTTSSYPTMAEKQLHSIPTHKSHHFTHTQKVAGDDDAIDYAHDETTSKDPLDNHFLESTTSKIQSQIIEVDTLVLIGTCERPPKGYIRFEHEEYQEEQIRLEQFRRHYCYMDEEHGQERVVVTEEEEGDYQRRESRRNTITSISPHRHKHLPVSESTATVKASGGKPGWTSSMLLVSEDAPLCTSISESSSPQMNSTSNAIGLDLSSSRGSSALGSSRRGGGGDRPSSTWAAIGAVEARGGGTTQNNEGLDVSSPTVSTQESSRPTLLEFDYEPIHIVRTLLPEEQPLQVRDEMLVKLMHLREKAEDEMGFHLNDYGGRKDDVELFRPAPTFRWYFQPCSPLGGIGSSASSPKVQAIPAYIDVEGYCTDNESDSDHDEINDVGSGDAEMNGGNDGRDSPEAEISYEMRILIEERRRIHVLRELTDTSFIVSGYLLKQSRRDPNVWRRVFCVLSEDRLWTIQRMKPLKNSGCSDGILSVLRIGRNEYITLHRSLLLEKGEGNDLTGQYSPSRCSGYYLSPLNHRLRNAFRLITDQGQSHTFRAFTSQSLHLWVASISERITQMHVDGMMDLANVIAEEETLARRRRMNGTAVLPLQLHRDASTESNSISMDIVRYGIAVASFRELCRHASGTELIDMVSSAWENARLVALKSAQLLHALTSMPPNTRDVDCVDADTCIDRNTIVEDLVEEQKAIQSLLGKHWDDLHNKATIAISLPPLTLFDSLLEKFQKSVEKDRR
jgi:hypothetical protein